MKNNKISIIAVGACTALACLVFSVTLVHAVFYAPDTELALPPQQQERPLSSSLPSEPPLRLRIPALGIDANVQQVGITTHDTMGVPNNFTDVGWYKYGPTPGQKGSAVIAGHVDNGLGLDGVFKHLGDIHVGDDLYVVTASSTLHFIVANIQTYPYEDVPSNLLFNQNDAARLNLITCTGAWVQGGRTYDHRLVVYAVMAG